MCGRFTLYADPDYIGDYFELENKDDILLESRYNIAPSQQIFTIVKGKTSFRGGYMKWGLIPSWAKEPSIGYKMINARSESVHEKPSFKSLLEKRHCLIAASGFFEWKKEEEHKQPYYIKYKTDEPLVMAGLWDRWKNKAGASVVSCTILTTEANDFMKELHHRMPVILPEEKWRKWLELPINSESNYAKELFAPLTSDNLTAYPVSTFVNKPQNEASVCIEKL